jgi:hypothetical protein
MLPHSLIPSAHRSASGPVPKLMPCLWPAVLIPSLLVSAAQAAPFSFDPVSFAGFANQTFRKQGKPLFVRNLGNCLREGKAGAGYRCFNGELMEDLPAKRGRNFCKVEAIWYVPLSRTVQVRTASCQFRSDQQRMIQQGEKLIRQGLEQLENQGR